MLASKQKLKFEYIVFCYQELYSFLILKDVSDKIADVVNKCDLLLL